MITVTVTRSFPKSVSLEGRKSQSFQEDETVFRIGGFVNKHKYRYWAAEKPGMLVCLERIQTRPKVIVWS